MCCLWPFDILEREVHFLKSVVKPFCNDAIEQLIVFISDHAFREISYKACHVDLRLRLSLLRIDALIVVWLRLLLLTVQNDTTVKRLITLDWFLNDKLSLLQFKQCSSPLWRARFIYICVGIILTNRYRNYILITLAILFKFSNTLEFIPEQIEFCRQNTSRQ